jgi:uncharacterized membrane protein
MLLFLTNFLSILLAGGLVLALLGLSSAATEGLRSPVRLRAFVLITVGILLVALPLTATTVGIFEQALIKSNTAIWAEEWLAGTDYDISQIEVSNDQVDLFIYGSGSRPELNILTDQMNTGYEHIASLRLLVIPSEEERYEFLQN